VEEQWGRRCPPSCIAGALPRRHGGGQREAHGGGSRRCRRAVEEADAELVVMEVDAIAMPWRRSSRRLTWSSLKKACGHRPHASAMASGTKNVIPILVLIRIIDQHHKKHMCYYKSFFYLVYLVVTFL
jgi:hypothetical protein